MWKKEKKKERKNNRKRKEERKDVGYYLLPEPASRNLEDLLLDPTSYKSITHRNTKLGSKPLPWDLRVEAMVSS